MNGKILKNLLLGSSSSEVIKVSGKITDYQCARESASFVFTENDKNKMGVIAVAAALAGLGGQAIAVASNANAVEEEADHVRFKLNGNPVQGWVWRSPFSEGDEVHVAAQWIGDHYEAFGIARPADKTIALYPHCSRSKTRHVKNAIKWWLIVVFGMYLCVTGVIFSITGYQKGFAFWSEAIHEGLEWFVGGIFLAFGIAIGSMAKQWMPFVTLAEKVFKILELPNPGNIDLVKSSKMQRTKQDAAEFGVMYFRY